jgi:hypothetical protein
MLLEYVLAGFIVYIIALLFKYLFKILWAAANWAAQKYIEEVLNVEITGEPMIDYFPAKEIFKVRKVLKNNGR